MNPVVAQAQCARVAPVRVPPPTEGVGLPREIWLLLGGNLLVRATGFAYPFMTYHVAAQGHGAGMVGAVLAVFGIGSVAGALAVRVAGGPVGPTVHDRDRHGVGRRGLGY